MGTRLNTALRAKSRLWSRLTIVVGVGLLSWWSALFTFTQITRLQDPAAALLANAKEPVALAVQADRLLLKAAEDKRLQKKATEQALLSLRSQALNPRALRILSFSHLNQNDLATMRKTLALAVRGSRQEVGAHLMFIEDYAAQDNIAGALKHYDLALRTSDSSRATLQPLLINALEDEQIAAAFVPYVKRWPTWLYPFLGAAIAESKRPENVAALIMRAGGLPKSPFSANLENALLSRLIEAGQFESTKLYFRSLKDTDPRLLVSPSLVGKNVSDRFPPMAWQPFNVSASGMNIIKGTTQDAALLIFAGSGERGLVARKTVFLDTGNYLFGIRFGASQMPLGGSVKWSIRCAGAQPAKSLWDSGLLRPSANSSERANFTVPADCLAQNIDIEMVGGQAQQGTELEISAISLGVV